MSNENKDAMIASIEKVQAVEEFLNGWYSVNDLFETAANAASVLLELMKLNVISDDDMNWFRQLIDQHIMMANLMKKFDRKEGEV